LLAAGAVVFLAAVAAAEPVRFTVVEAKSSVRIHVGKSGAFSFAGHRHEVEAPVSGTVTADAAALSASSVDLRFASARLRVLPEGEPEGDAPKVEDVMHGAQVLEAGRFPEIRFVSKHVEGQRSGEAYDLRIVGDLTLHGVTAELTVPVRVALDASTLTATGQATVRHDQFGLKPVSAGGGTVKVANEIRIEFRIVAERR
jgi:polyisoprenoid-binding protein YceI